MNIPVVRNILEANDRIAEQNRQIFKDNSVLTINLMSSPGAGKTTLLEKTIDALKNDIRIGVIEGDIETARDAERIAAKGVPAVQINTKGACHLDGNMIRDTFNEFNFAEIDLLVVENVGNLVCPAEFKIGEDFKVMILSVTEGDDKPGKYPLMFHESKVLLINKMDLLPYVDCSVDKISEDALNINPNIIIFPVSCKTGKGLDEWFKWLKERVREKKTES